MMRTFIGFSLVPPVTYAIVVDLVFPLLLALVARWEPLRRRTAWQFLVTAAVLILVWIGCVVGDGTIDSIVDIVVGLMVIGAGTIVYLEAWALLTRGYTLGLLLVLYRAGRPLRGIDLAAAYRGGEGLSWIMDHRLAGLVGAGLVRREGPEVWLTPVLGRLVARTYAVSVKMLGLGRTG